MRTYAAKTPKTVTESRFSPTFSKAGQPLDVKTRTFMESRFHHDFSRVRVHAHAEAAAAANAANAAAYTTGTDIVFAQGRYAPSSLSGQRLLAHELTHVIQQTSGPIRMQRAPANAEGENASIPAAVTASNSEESVAAAVSTDAAIDALDLAATAKAGAEALKAKHPSIAFTSGRRSVADQASAMAENIVVSKNRNWIKETYAAASALQKWVDDNPKAVTKSEIATGLEATLNGLAESDRGKVSKHLSGEAFDVQPQESNASTIKSDIKALSGLSKFLEKEGGLIRWHAQFKKLQSDGCVADPLEHEADLVAERIVRGGSY